MKKSIRLMPCLVMALGVFACNKSGGNGAGGDVATQILGKEYMCYEVFESSGLPAESTTHISFISRSVCNVFHYGYDWDYDFKKDSWSYDEKPGYEVRDGVIVTEPLAWNQEGLRLRLVAGNLVSVDNSSEVYLYHGTVELDSSTDPPQGDRSIIPVGWYESGSYEDYVKTQAGYCQATGDYEGLANLPNQVSGRGGITGIHVVNETTFETTIGAISTRQPSSYYAKQNFSVGSRSCTFYFYYAYPFATYTYRILDGKLYLKNKNDVWEEEGPCKISGNTLEGIFFDSLKKVNYSGDYEW